MTDWLDPFGFRGLADRFFTSAARTLVGRRVEVQAPTPMAATVARVHEAAPAASMTAALNAQVGLWRRLDLVFERVDIDSRPLHQMRVVASDVRVIDAMPQRLGAKRLDIEIEARPAHVTAWIDVMKMKAEARIEDGVLLARHPRWGRLGEVVLEPWARGRELGAEAVSARVRGREFRLPARFRRTFRRELTWLPERTELLDVELPADGGIRLTAAIDRFEVPVDVPKLMTDLGTKGTRLAVQMMTPPI